VAGAAVSVTHGIQELLHPEPAGHFLVGYVVLAVSFVLEGVAVRLRALEARFCGSPAVAGAVLSLSAPDEPSLHA